MGGNRYEYPNGVLRNKLGIQNAEDLAHVEATLTALRMAELEMQPPTGRFDLDYLQALHRLSSWTCIHGRESYAK